MISRLEPGGGLGVVREPSLVFASCYLVSVGILHVGSLVVSMGPLIVGASLYVAVALVSPAILTVSRED